MVRERGVMLEALKMTVRKRNLFHWRVEMYQLIRTKDIFI